MKTEICNYQESTITRNVTRILVLFVLAMGLVGIQCVLAQQGDPILRKHAMEMASDFSENPKLAEDVIEALGDKERLTQTPAFGDLLKQTPSEFRESALLISLGKVQQKLSVTSLNKLASYADARAALKSLKDEERQVDLRTATRALGEIVTRAETNTRVTLSFKPAKELVDPSSRQRLTEHGKLLQNIATNQTESIDLRRMVTRDLAILDVQDGIKDLRRMANNSDASEPLLVQKEALLALSYMFDNTVEQLATRLLKATKDKDGRLYGSAAHSLGQLKTTNALQVLVDNAGISAEQPLALRAAVHEYAPWVNDTITNGPGDNLLLAVKSIRLIQGFEPDMYKGRLKALLTRLNPEQDKLVLGEVLKQLTAARLEKTDAVEILKLLGAHGIDASVNYPDEYSYLHMLATSQPVIEKRTEAHQ